MTADTPNFPPRLQPDEPVDEAERPGGASDQAVLADLRAADPVTGTELPTSWDPAPQTLLNGILAEAEGTAGTRSASANQPLAALGTPAATDTTENMNAPVDLRDRQAPDSRSRTRGRVLMAAAALLVMALVGTLLAFVPASSQTALAQVQTAAAATASAQTGRMESSFSGSFTDEAGGRGEDISGAVSVAYAGDDLQVTTRWGTLTGELLESREAQGAIESLLDVTQDIRYVNDVVYLRFPGGGWRALETRGVFDQFVSDQVNPGGVLQAVQELTEIEEVGPATVDGLAVTHFRSVVELGEESLESSGLMPFERLPFESNGQITLDLYLNDDVLYRLDVNGDIASPNGADQGAGVFQATTVYTDVGERVVIEVPEGAETLDPVSGLDAFFGD